VHDNLPRLIPYPSLGASTFGQRQRKNINNSLLRQLYDFVHREDTGRAFFEFSFSASLFCGNIRLIFAYTVSMFPGPASDSHPFVIICKGCRQNIPAPVQTMPGSWVVADCPLCGEKRRYLPVEIFQGRLSPELLAKPLRIADRR